MIDYNRLFATVLIRMFEQINLNIMKIALTIFGLFLCATLFSQVSTTVTLTSIAIEEVDGSNSPYIEYTDSLGTKETKWFRLYCHPMGAELQLDETSVMYGTPDGPECYYEMNESFQLTPKEVVIQYEELEDEIGGSYWIITSINTAIN